MEVEDIAQYLIRSFNGDVDVELTTISGTQRFSKASELEEELRQQPDLPDIADITAVGITYENPNNNEIIKRTISFEFDAEEQEGHLVDDYSETEYLYENEDLDNDEGEDDE